MDDFDMGGNMYKTHNEKRSLNKVTKDDKSLVD